MPLKDSCNNIKSIMHSLTVQKRSFPSQSKPCRAQFPPIIASGDEIFPSFPRTIALAPSETYRETLKEKETADNETSEYTSQKESFQHYHYQFS